MNNKLAWFETKDEADEFSKHIAGSRVVNSPLGDWYAVYDGNAQPPPVPEVALRHRVKCLDETFVPKGDGTEFTVGLQSLCGVYDKENRYFAITRDQAHLFKVGTVIEVVLRPQPLPEEPKK